MTGYTEKEILGRNCRFLQGPGTSRQAVSSLLNPFSICSLKCLHSFAIWAQQCSSYSSASCTRTSSSSWALGQKVHQTNQAKTKARNDHLQVQELRNCIQEDRGCTVCLMNYTKDGKPFWNQLCLAPVRDDNGVCCYLGIQTNVTGAVLAYRSRQFSPFQTQTETAGKSSVCAT